MNGPIGTRRRRVAALCTVTALVAGTLPATAYAAPRAAPGTASATVDAGARDRPDPPQRLETYEREQPVAPGVRMRSFDRYGPDEHTGEPTWLQADSLTADLTKGTTVDYLFPGQVAAGEKLTTTAKRAGAVAAVNGDYFDIDRSEAAEGVGIRDGRLIQSPGNEEPGQTQNVVITPDGLGQVNDILFEGSIALPGGETAELAGLNKPRLGSGGIAAFTPLWGTHCRCRATEDAGASREVEVTDGKVTRSSKAPGKGAIDRDSFVLVGREKGAEKLAGLEVGDPVTIDYSARTADEQKIQAAVHGRQMLVVDGEAQRAVETDTTTEPRTAVGFSADGQTMFVLTADGRQPELAEGLGLDELADMMIELGADDAINLDGGGSTTFVARDPGGSTPSVRNRPSDGEQRPVPNGLGLFAPKGSGDLEGYWVRTKIDPEEGPGATEVAPSRTDRAFPGLRRSLHGAGYDETFGPAGGVARWHVAGGAGRVDDAGVFVGRREGKATVTARRGAAKGELDLTVLGELSRITTSAERLSIPERGESTTFGVLGHDTRGFEAPIEPADIELDYDADLVSIDPQPDGNFQATAKSADGAGQLTIRVDGVQTTIPVTTGTKQEAVADFEDAGKWTGEAARATGELSVAEGRAGKGLKMAYDYTQSTGTRAYYARPPKPIEVPGQPQKFTMWIHGSGNGEWASLQFYDADDNLLPALRGPDITWTGWKQVTFDVPPGVKYPLKLHQFYAPETRADHQYQSEIVIDEITALVPPDVDAPEPKVVRDPVVAEPGQVERMPWRYAVLSDAQFVAAEPNSDLVANTRRALKEIRAARPDFLLINGDLVDEASTADLEFAKQILEEELGEEIPYHYVPGNHEVADGTLDSFVRVFGHTQEVFDHRGTRFILQDTSGLSLRGSDWKQLGKLRRELDEAAEDPGVRSVVVAQHVPTRDPNPDKASQLSDRKEAALIERWLGEFGEETGKGAAFSGGHVGTFDAARVDGVPYVVNGNAAKTPTGGAVRGGFNGWSLWGVDPDGTSTGTRRPWVQTEIRPQVDALRLTAPQRITVGQSADVAAAVVQNEREVAVEYPMSAGWSGSSNLHIGSPEDAERRHAAAYDAKTGTLTALGEGRITLKLTVNGKTSTRRVTIGR